MRLKTFIESPFFKILVQGYGLYNKGFTCIAQNSQIQGTKFNNYLVGYRMKKKKNSLKSLYSKGVLNSSLFCSHMMNCGTATLRSHIILQVKQIKSVLASMQLCNASFKI